jgi:hypothetical protein
VPFKCNLQRYSAVRLDPEHRCKYCKRTGGKTKYCGTNKAPGGCKRLPRSGGCKR